MTDAKNMLTGKELGSRQIMDKRIRLISMTDTLGTVLGRRVSTRPNALSRVRQWWSQMIRSGEKQSNHDGWEN